MGELIWSVVFMVLGWAIPALWVLARRHAQLGLAGHVFPATPGRANRVVMHLRASFDTVEFGENPPTMRGYTHAGDVQAVMEIAEYFDHLPVEIEFDYFPEIRSDMRNVVIVGLSSRSDVSRELGQDLYNLGLRVKGINAHAFYRDAGGTEYHCEHLESDGKFIVTKDAGIIVRKSTQDGATILLCGGIHTFGSQAAAEVALSREFQRRVRKSKLKEFVQFVTVDVQSGGGRAGLAIVRHSIRWKEHPLQRLEAAGLAGQ
jgi:hypothetical protein